MWLVVVAPKDPAEECCTLSILETFLWKAMKPFQTYSAWQCNYALAEKVVPHLASGINANNIGLRARLLKRHVEREECIPNSKLFSLVSGLVSQLVVQLVWDAVSVLWLVSKNSCAIGETVWGLRWCNFHSVPPSLWHHFRPYLIAVLHPMHLERKNSSANSQVDRAFFFKPRAKPKGRILRITCKSTKQLATKAAHFEESLEFALDGFQVVLSSILNGIPRKHVHRSLIKNLKMRPRIGYVLNPLQGNSIFSTWSRKTQLRR